MILKASQRAGGRQLALHLLNAQDNEHVHVHEVRGFVSDQLEQAFKEAYAISQGTKCRQFLFSLSLSPPETAKVPVDVFEDAVGRIEKKLNLTGQPRAIVFHEKEGRRHAHCVWSRIDVQNMRAVHLPHFKRKLTDISRELYIENNWSMPKGLMNQENRNPLNFSIEEWQQAKRQKRDPRDIKQVFQECWAASDSGNAFAKALEENGYYLARGDRRGYVAVDWQGEVYAIARWTGKKTKDVRMKLGDVTDLPSVDEARQRISSKISQKAKNFADQEIEKLSCEMAVINEKIRTLTAKHQLERSQLEENQAKKRIEETNIRAQRLPTGIQALWFRMTGLYAKIKQTNEEEAKRHEQKDQIERQKLIERQINERRTIQHEKFLMRRNHRLQINKVYKGHNPEDKFNRQKGKICRISRSKFT